MLKLTRSEMVDVLSAIMSREDQINRMMPSAKRNVALAMGATLLNLQFVKEAIQKELGEE